jgi:hypothetical protein
MVKTEGIVFMELNLQSIVQFQAKTKTGLITRNNDYILISINISLLEKTDVTNRFGGLLR